MRLARVLGAVGRACITGGVLILLFVAYQLWGTGLREAQAQNRLEDDFAEVLEDAPKSTTTTTSTTTTSTTTTTTSATSATTTTTRPAAPVTTEAPETAPTIEPVPEGEATARIRIPTIGVDKIVVEGVSLDDLKKGPGHYPETPLPGQEGNAAIAGHRTTYGAPFNRIDELVAGDEILVETVQGEFRYLVTEQLVVSPTQVEVLDDKGDNRLTLTACHPKYSARQRIIVVAELAPEEKPFRFVRPARGDDGDVGAGDPSEPSPPPALDDIDGEGAPAWPAIVLGLLCAAIWLLAWALGRRWRKWPAYAIGLPFFLVSLFFFFEEFSRLLPSNF